MEFKQKHNFTFYFFDELTLRKHKQLNIQISVFREIEIPLYSTNLASIRNVLEYADSFYVQLGSDVDDLNSSSLNM